MLQAGSLEISTLWQDKPAFQESTTAFYEGLHLALTHQSPRVAELWPNSDALKGLFSPFAVQIPQSTYEQAQELIQALWHLSQKPAYRKQVTSQQGSTAPPSAWPAASGVLMAFDFHLGEDSQLRLIEVNTNAAGFLLVNNLYKNNRSSTDQLLASFAKDYQLFVDSLEFSGRPDFSSCHLAIVDQDLLGQKMLPEFYLYQSLFSSRGLQCSLLDITELAVNSGRLCGPDGRPIDFVYNRCTDFYLEQPDSSALRWAYENHACCVSPHPAVYALLADKRRIMDWKAWDCLPEKITECLLGTRPLSSFSDPEQVWGQRKNLFFKPQSSHGGKQVYRGSSISKKMFMNLWGNPDMLAQEYFPSAPPTFIGPLRPASNEGWKYDIRFYVYEDQIQLGAARLYQGQVTNFSTPLGGFAPLTFS